MKRTLVLFTAAITSLASYSQTYTSSTQITKETFRENGNTVYRTTYHDFIRLDNYSDAAVCMRNIRAYGERNAGYNFSFTLYAMSSEALHDLAMEAWKRVLVTTTTIVFSDGTSTRINCEVQNLGKEHSKNTTYSIVDIRLIPNKVGQIQSLTLQDIKSITIGNLTVPFSIFTNSAQLFESIVSAYSSLSGKQLL